MVWGGLGWGIRADLRCKERRFVRLYVWSERGHCFALAIWLRALEALLRRGSDGGGVAIWIARFLTFLASLRNYDFGPLRLDLSHNSIGSSGCGSGSYWLTWSFRSKLRLRCVISSTAWRLSSRDLFCTTQ